MASKPHFPRRQSLWRLCADVFLEEYNPKGSEEEGSMDVSQRSRESKYKCDMEMWASA